MKIEGEMTFHGLEKWYKRLFEKLGWMVLAFQRGHEDKILNYIEGIEHFLVQAENKYKTLSSSDTKKDLAIMIQNVKILLVHVLEDFVL